MKLATRGVEVAMIERDTDDDRSRLGSAPESRTTVEDQDALREKCKTDRDSLAPRETADCAGIDLADLYENEEDGGS